MRRVATAVVAVVLTAGCLVVLAPAVLASRGAATPFSASYEYPDGTYWNCSGARVENRVSTKDSETCLATGDTSMLAPGTYAGDPYGDLPWFPNALWASDFDGRVADHWAVSVSDNGDGSSTVKVVAYY